MLSITKVAKIFGVSRMTVYRMIKDGRLIAVQLGKTLRVEEEEVERVRNRTTK